MPRVRIVHWRPDEAGPLVNACQAPGWKTDCHGDPSGPVIMRAIRENMPNAVVIDLSRLPSHGREIAVWIRQTKRTRHLPIVFVNGIAAKVASVREILPDAVYTETSGVAVALQALEGRAFTDPVVPPAMMQRYQSRTTAQKLGIGASSTVGVMNAPSHCAAVLGELPEGVSVLEDPVAVQQVTLWFVHDVDGLRRSLRRMRAMADQTKLWIVWPKDGRHEFRENAIRNIAIEGGLVDYKICSLDAQWSGILFARKREKGASTD